MHPRKAKLDLVFSTKLSHINVSEVLRCSLACKMVFLLERLVFLSGLRSRGSCDGSLPALVCLSAYSVARNVRVSGVFKD